VARKTRKKETEVVGLLGVGLDNRDGHQRITRGEDFLLVGGSAQTHEHMQDVAIRVTESFHEKGQRLQDISGEEVADLIRKVLGR
jgi:hypothetical protein